MADSQTLWQEGQKLFANTCIDKFPYIFHVSQLISEIKSIYCWIVCAATIWTTMQSNKKGHTVSAGHDKTTDIW